MRRVQDFFVLPQGCGPSPQSFRERGDVIQCLLMITPIVVDLVLLEVYVTLGDDHSRE